MFRPAASGGGTVLREVYCFELGVSAGSNNASASFHFNVAFDAAGANGDVSGDGCADSHNRDL